MPKVSFYLRNEDVDKWKAIQKKTGWIHSKLNDKEIYMNGKDPIMVMEPDPMDEPIVTSNRVKLRKPIAFTDNTIITADRLNNTVTIDNGIESQTITTCKHGASQEHCRFAKVINGKKVCK